MITTLSSIHSPNWHALVAISNWFVGSELYNMLDTEF